MSSENRILLQLKKLDFDFDIVHNENFLSATAALHLALTLALTTAKICWL